MAKIIKDTYLSLSSFIGTSNDDVYTFTINNWNNRDSFDGGDGFDTLQVNINATGTITIDLTDGLIGVNNSPSLPLIFNFESLDLRQYSNFGANIIGNNSNNPMSADRMGILLFYNGAQSHMSQNSFTFLDSPSTTSATTYKVTFKNRETNAVHFNAYTGDTSTFTLYEIAG